MNPFQARVQSHPRSPHFIYTQALVPGLEQDKSGVGALDLLWETPSSAQSPMRP